MLFSQLYKIMVKKVTLVGFRENDRPNRTPLNPPLSHVCVTFISKDDLGKKLSARIGLHQQPFRLENVKLLYV